MKDSRCAPIGVFDSGIGGLSVLKALRDQLPNERFIYLGDTARLPYGTRGDDTIIRYSYECASFLIRRGAKMIVGACNTASSIAGDFLSANLPVPFVGTVEPSISCVLRAAVSRSIWILGTEGTVRSGSYQKRLSSYLPSSCRIEALACPLFVPLAEEGLTDGAVCDAVMDLYLAPVRASAPEAVLLACTHYPLLARAISSYLGPRTVVLDGSVAVAEAVKGSLCSRNEMVNETDCDDHHYGSLTCIVTDGAPRVNRLAERFLGESQLQVSVVSIDNGEQQSS